jgi:hypothetical protein
MSKIFGIGFSKTGTTTLREALSLLGYRIARTDKESWPPKDDFDAATHEWVSAFFEEMDLNYPDSKFICTVRDKDEWLRSIQRHNALIRLQNLENTDKDKAIMLRRYGALRRPRYAGSLFAAYDRHLNKVKQHFADRDGDVLFLNICAGEGWEKLCPFLGAPVPDAPFPRENVRMSPMLYYLNRFGKARKRLCKVPKRLWKQYLRD